MDKNEIVKKLTNAGFVSVGGGRGYTYSLSKDIELDILLTDKVAIYTLEGNYGGKVASGDYPDFDVDTFIKVVKDWENAIHFLKQQCQLNFDDIDGDAENNIISSTEADFRYGFWGQMHLGTTHSLLVFLPVSFSARNKVNVYLIDDRKKKILNSGDFKFIQQEKTLFKVNSGKTSIMQAPENLEELYSYMVGDKND